MAKQKSFLEWKKILNQLDSDTFGDLCEHLLEDMDFYGLNIKKGGADEGRDIEAKYDKLEPDKFTKTREQWFIECKRYSSGISVDDVMNKVNWSIAEDADYVAFMSNSYLTKSAKKWVKKMSKRFKIRVIQWTDNDFFRVLFKHLDTVKYFFPNEEIPDRFKK
ncbi:MAG: restriction endonuclease [Bacteroidales bacterium]|nr:restriction endonuclease [Bacteroidales bacterium]